MTSKLCFIRLMEKLDLKKKKAKSFCVCERENKEKSQTRVEYLLEMPQIKGSVEFRMRMAPVYSYP